MRLMLLAGSTALLPADDVADMVSGLGHDPWGYRDAKGRGLWRATDYPAAPEYRADAGAGR